MQYTRMSTMQLGDLAVTFSTKKTPEGKFFGIARVVWQDAGQVHTQDWNFNAHPRDTEAEALMVAEGRIGHLFMSGKLGGDGNGNPGPWLTPLPLVRGRRYLP